MNIWLVRPTCDLISLVNDNHVDNNLRENLVYAYSGSIANNRPKTVFTLNTGTLQRLKFEKKKKNPFYYQLMCLLKPGRRVAM